MGIPAGHQCDQDAADKLTKQACGPGGLARAQVLAASAQIVDDAPKFFSPVSPKAADLSIIAKIFYMTIGGVVVALGFMTHQFIAAKRSRARETIGKTLTVELPASTFD